MRKGILTFAAVGLLATGSMAACGDNGGSDQAGSTKKPKIGVILPDSKSSARWETADRKYLEEAFKAAGVEYKIENAQDDKTAFQTIADPMISDGVNVLMIVNLDSGTGKAVLDKAKAQGVGHHRLRPAHPRRLGGLLRQLRQRGGRQAPGRGPGQVPDRQGRQEPGDRRAQRLADRQQRHPVQERLRLGAQAEVRLQGIHQGRRHPVPDWDNAQAATIFEQSSPRGRQDRRGARRQRRSRQRGHLGAEEEQAQRQGPGDRPGRHRRRACRTSSPVTSA